MISMTRGILPHSSAPERPLKLVAMRSLCHLRRCFLGWALLVALCKSWADALEGRALYTTSCAHCHGADGQGWPEKNGPTLRGTDWVTGDPGRLIRITLGGLYLRIPLLGGTHYGSMIGVKDQLDDKAVASVLTYIRTSWGNQADAITPEAVAALRPEVNRRRLPYSAASFGLSPKPNLGPNGEALIPPNPFAAAGYKVYQDICANCHRPNGLGIVTDDGHGYPPLAGSELVVGSPRTLARIVLGGLQGPVPVQGKFFNEVMPMWHPALTDEQIAQVLTFLRQSWTNLEPPVPTALVSSLRRESVKREGIPWSITEVKRLEQREEDLP